MVEMSARQSEPLHVFVTFFKHSSMHGSVQLHVFVPLFKTSSMHGSVPLFRHSSAPFHRSAPLQKHTAIVAIRLFLPPFRCSCSS